MKCSRRSTTGLPTRAIHCNYARRCGFKSGFIEWIQTSFPEFWIATIFTPAPLRFTSSVINGNGWTIPISFCIEGLPMITRESDWRP